MAIKIHGEGKWGITIEYNDYGASFGNVENVLEIVLTIRQHGEYT